MTEPPPDYISNEDHGDETDARPKETHTMSGKSNTQYTLTGSDGDAPLLPRCLMGGHDAAYWQAQAEQAQAERDAALAQLASVKRQLAQTGDTLHAERRAAVAQQRRSHLD